MGNLKLWLKGLVAAIIGGAATSTAGIITDPSMLTSAGMKKLGITALAGALVGIAAYFKQSPITPAVK